VEADCLANFGPDRRDAVTGRDTARQVRHSSFRRSSRSRPHSASRLLLEPCLFRDTGVGPGCKVVRWFACNRPISPFRRGLSGHDPP
jgi:hypothetical protein